MDATDRADLTVETAYLCADAKGAVLWARVRKPDEHEFFVAAVGQWPLIKAMYTRPDPESVWTRVFSAAGFDMFLGTTPRGGARVKLMFGPNGRSIFQCLTLAANTTMTSLPRDFHVVWPGTAETG